MRIAALVKQIPVLESMRLGADGRIERESLAPEALEMNAYCRRAVAEACTLAAGSPPGEVNEVIVFTLGPQPAADVLREAIAWGDAHGAAIRGVHLCDPAFAGSDTLATARTVAAALELEGRFDLVLCGRNSLDADTGQVGPQIAELLGLPFVTGVRHLYVEGTTASARAELDDGWLHVVIDLPAVLSCAERLCDPAKVDPAGRAAVDPSRITTLTARDLGAGPWGAAASPTRVGEVRLVEPRRAGLRWPDEPLVTQVDRALTAIRSQLADTMRLTAAQGAAVRRMVGVDGGTVVVLVEPQREGITAELLATAEKLGDVVVAIGTADAIGEPPAGAAGAHHAVSISGSDLEIDVADAAARWITRHDVAIVLAPGTAWGREVAARVAARTGSGLTGDATDLELVDGRLVAWKPAFGGALVAAITAASSIQMATVRAGVLPAPTQPLAEPPTLEPVIAARDPRIRVLARTRDDDIEVLADARVVIGVGRGVDPAGYDLLDTLRVALDAELAATRKVTDNGWMPRSRQVGVTGRSIAPDLYLSIAAGGKYNHSIGYRNARAVIVVNHDPHALAFATADAGIVGDWADVVPLLVDRAAEMRDLAGVRASGVQAASDLAGGR